MTRRVLPALVCAVFALCFAVTMREIAEARGAASVKPIDVAVATRRL